MVIWTWLKSHLTAVLVALAAALGAGIVWQYHKRKVGSLKDLVEVEKAQTEIAALEARRVALSERATEKATAIVEIDKRLDDNRRRIVAVHEEVAALTDKQVLDRLAQLGY